MSELRKMAEAACRRNPFFTVGPYGPKVRVISRPAPKASCDLVVQWKDKDGGWHDHGTVFNDVEDEFAHSNAGAAARILRGRILEGEAP
jgi:hypothetical protein